MLRWLLLLPFLLGFLSQDASAQIYINPGDGVTIAPGGHIHVDNWTGLPATVVIQLSDGTVLAAIELPPEGWCDFKIPNDPRLLGTKVTTTATNGAETETSTNPIGTSSDGAARLPDASRESLQRSDVRDVSPPRL
jgi:hypothetical protein